MACTACAGASGQCTSGLAVHGASWQRDMGRQAGRVLRLPPQPTPQQQSYTQDLPEGGEKQQRDRAPVCMAVAQVRPCTSVPNRSWKGSGAQGPAGLQMPMQIRSGHSTLLPAKGAAVVLPLTHAAAAPATTHTCLLCRSCPTTRTAQRTLRSP